MHRWLRDAVEAVRAAGGTKVRVLHKTRHTKIAFRLDGKARYLLISRSVPGPRNVRNLLAAIKRMAQGGDSGPERGVVVPPEGATRGDDPLHPARPRRN